MDTYDDERDFSILFQHLKQKGYSDSKIEADFEKAFGNGPFEGATIIAEGSPECKDLDKEMIEQGWGFLFNEGKTE